MIASMLAHASAVIWMLTNSDRRGLMYASSKNLLSLPSEPQA